MPRDIQQFFKFGLDRDIPALARGPFEFISLELGPGRKKIIPDVDVRLGLDMTVCDARWDARADDIPCLDNSVGEIHAYQFFEHLTGSTAVRTLRECERVLAPGGVLNIVTPYYSSAHQAQALDHKSFWSEETWHWLFNNEYYDDHQGQGWKLKVHCCFGMFIVERNMDLFTQLVKTE